MKLSIQIHRLCAAGASRDGGHPTELAFDVVDDRPYCEQVGHPLHVRVFGRPGGKQELWVPLPGHKEVDAGKVDASEYLWLLERERTALNDYLLDLMVTYRPDDAGDDADVLYRRERLVRMMGVAVLR